MTKEQRLEKFKSEYPYFLRENNAYKNWKEKYPEKIIAHRKVFTLVRNGTLKKQNCFCGSNKVEAHHEDYNKPLDIKWLCKKHHIEADRIRKLST